MTTLAAAILQAPNPTHGSLTGEGAWRFALQAWLPGFAAARVGSATVGSSTVGPDRAWVDMTQFVQGIETFRGSNQFGGSPEVGTALMRLKSANHELAPWMRNPASWGGYGFDFRPGLLMRVVVFSGSTWFPLFTGEVERWTGRFGQDAVEPHVEVTLLDTVGARLAQSYHRLFDSPLLITRVDDQLDEILTSARWPYGRRLFNANVAGSTWYAKGSTPNPLDIERGSLELARDVAAGAQLAVFADAAGRILVRLVRPTLGSRQPNDLSPASPTLALSDDDLEHGVEITTDVEAMINRASYTFADQTYVFENPQSIEQYGLREFVDSFPRQGVPTLAEENDYLAGLVAKRAHLIDRIDEVTLTGTRHDLQRSVELGSPFTIDASPRRTNYAINATGFVRSIEHSIVPRHANAIHWATRFGLDTYELSSFEAEPGGLTYKGDTLTFNGDVLTYP